MAPMRAMRQAPRAWDADFAVPAAAPAPLLAKGDAKGDGRVASVTQDLFSAYASRAASMESSIAALTGDLEATRQREADAAGERDRLDEGLRAATRDLEDERRGGARAGSPRARGGDQARQAQLGVHGADEKARGRLGQLRLAAAEALQCLERGSAAARGGDAAGDGAAHDELGARRGLGDGGARRARAQAEAARAAEADARARAAEAEDDLAELRATQAERQSYVDGAEAPRLPRLLQSADGRAAARAAAREDYRARAARRSASTGSSTTRSGPSPRATPPGAARRARAALADATARAADHLEVCAAVREALLASAVSADTRTEALDAREARLSARTLARSGLAARKAVADRVVAEAAAADRTSHDLMKALESRERACGAPSRGPRRPATGGEGEADLARRRAAADALEAELQGAAEAAVDAAQRAGAVSETKEARGRDRSRARADAAIAAADAAASARRAAEESARRCLDRDRAEFEERARARGEERAREDLEAWEQRRDEEERLRAEAERELLDIASEAALAREAYAGVADAGRRRPRGEERARPRGGARVAVRGDDAAQRRGQGRGGDGRRRAAADDDARASGAGELARGRGAATEANMRRRLDEDRARMEQASTAAARSIAESKRRADAEEARFEAAKDARGAAFGAQAEAAAAKAEARADKAEATKAKNGALVRQCRARDAQVKGAEAAAAAAGDSAPRPLERDHDAALGEAKARVEAALRDADEAARNADRSRRHATRRRAERERHKILLGFDAVRKDLNRQREALEEEKATFVVSQAELAAASDAAYRAVHDLERSRRGAPHGLLDTPVPGSAAAAGPRRPAARGLFSASPRDDESDGPDYGPASSPEPSRGAPTPGRAPPRDLSPLAAPFPSQRAPAAARATTRRRRRAASERRRGDHDDWASAQIADDHFRAAGLARCARARASANRARVDRAAAAIGDRGRLRAALAVWAEPPPLPWARSP
ncbi:hypothetical protein SO694_00049059 [Aureococcus anophagefferens]|uniref:Uncharacterized protein n=1 Tax=Aureococcus anophagefferens TaxID=44056 RepID=A0ABR1G8H0_AURAN